MTEQKASSKLTPERRKEIASAAAKAKWEKLRKAKEAAEAAPPAEVVTEPAPSPAADPSKRIKQPTVNPAYGKALAAAEKEYEKSIQDLSYHEQMVVMLRARIPTLVQTIRVLGGTVSYSQLPAMNQGGEQMMPVAYTPQPQAQMPAQEPINLPPIPRAHGGAMGVIDDMPQAPKEDENIFLRDGEKGNWM